MPDDQDDRADHQEDDHRRHDCTGADAPLGRREHPLDGIPEPVSLALLLVERLDDLHRPQNLGGDGPDFGDPCLVAGRNATHAASQYHDRAEHDGYPE